MEPRELLRLLMVRNKENAHSLSIKLRAKGVTQPQLHKFLTGATAEPRRSTLQPLAEHYGVAVDAFYDEAAATAEAQRLGLIEGVSAPAPAQPPAEPEHPYNEITGPELALLEDFRVIPDEDQEEIRQDIIHRAYKARGHIKKVLTAMGLAAPTADEIDQALVQKSTTQRLSMSDNTYKAGSTSDGSSPEVTQPQLKRSTMERLDERLQGGDEDDEDSSYLRSNGQGNG